MKRSAIIIILLATLLVPTGDASASTGQSPWIGQAIALANRERKTRGVPELTVNPTLEWAAATKLSDMEKNGYFAHTSPSGLTPWSFMDKVGYDYHYAGENLAIHFTDPENEHVAWMQSEKHCQNILDPRFVEIGMAAKKTFFEGRETMLVVEMFGTRSGQESATKLTKEDAIAMCGNGSPSVSGVSADRQSGDSVSAGRIALLSGPVFPDSAAVADMTNTMTGGRYGVAEIVSTATFALAQIAVVILSIRLLLSREAREGVYVS